MGMTGLFNTLFVLFFFSYWLYCVYATGHAWRNRQLVPPVDIEHGPTVGFLSALVGPMQVVFAFALPLFIGWIAQSAYRDGMVWDFHHGMGWQEIEWSACEHAGGKVAWEEYEVPQGGVGQALRTLDCDMGPGRSRTTYTAVGRTILAVTVSPVASPMPTPRAHVKNNANTGPRKRQP